MSKAQEVAELEELLLWEQRRNSFFHFMQYVKPELLINWHHKIIGNRLSKLSVQQQQNLVIMLPPQISKSEMVSRLLPAFLLGHKPWLKIIIASYSADLASSFNRDVQRLLESPTYRELFPHVTLNSKNVVSTTGGWKRTGDFFETVGYGGYVKTVGVGGSLTGFRADCLAQGTQVLTSNGLKNIEDIELNDNVMSYNHDKLEYEFDRVIAKRMIRNRDVVKLDTESTHLICTKDHRVLTHSGYCEVENILDDERVMLFAHGFTTVNAISPCRDKQTVYDIQTEKNHNFFANGILAHNCMIVDDPIKGREQADSYVVQERVNEWYQSVALTRCSRNANRIIMHTPWSLRDISFRMMAAAKQNPKAIQWEWLRFPAVAEGTLHPKDPREPGEPIFPEWYGGPEEMEQKRLAVGEREWASLYQCNPTPRGGTIIKEDWIQYYDRQPELDIFDEIIQSWDLRFSRNASANDFVVGQVWGRKGADKYLLDHVRGRWSFRETLKKFQLLTKKWPMTFKKLVENKANGPALEDSLRKNISGIVLWEPKGNKEQRLYKTEPAFEAGNVYFPSSMPWTQEVVFEITNFPVAPHDDIVDACTMALIELTKTEGRSFEVIAL